MCEFFYHLFIHFSNYRKLELFLLLAFMPFVFIFFICLFSFSIHFKLKINVILIKLLMLFLILGPPPESDDQMRLRFQIELEFVQCLANPNYLNCMYSILTVKASKLNSWSEMIFRGKSPWSKLENFLKMFNIIAFGRCFWNRLQILINAFKLTHVLGGLINNSPIIFFQRLTW